MTYTTCRMPYYKACERQNWWNHSKAVKEHQGLAYAFLLPPKDGSLGSDWRLKVWFETKAERNARMMARL